MSKPRVLIIDDEEGIRSSLSLVLTDEGYETQTAANAAEALERARTEPFSVVLCDVRMPSRSGLELLPELRGCLPDAVLLMMSAYGDTEQAIEAVQRGAADYLSKPFQADELLLAIRKAVERRRLERENRQMRRELAAGRGGRALTAASEPMKQVLELVDRASEYKTTVLITGESGVGKEVIARSIHDLSERASEAFVAVNCGAIPENLLESEFFGHVRGAFTGANEAKPGLFCEADGGTLFLDEIGELPLAMQVKLLRVLQEEEVRPVGKPRAVKVDIRIIAATSRELEDEVEAERFRADLFYRLNVFRIRVPPLRERIEDLPPLVDHLLSALCARVGKHVEPVSRELLDALAGYHWPGNVRELENSLERALILTRSHELELAHFPFAGPGGSQGPSREPSRPAPPGDAEAELSIKQQTRLLEERLIRRALARTKGNRTKASRILEISARALQYKIKEYGIEPLNPISDDSDSK